VSQISDPNNAIQRVAHQLADREDADDPGLLKEFGEELLAVGEAIAARVRQTNKAFKGHVTLKLNLHGYRTKGKEVAVDIEPDISAKKPNRARKRGVTMYLGHNGELSTVPVQEEMPLFTKETARVVPGVGNDDAAIGAAEKRQGKKAQ
jgi:hypothetical protein